MQHLAKGVLPVEDPRVARDDAVDDAVPDVADDGREHLAHGDVG